MRYKIPDVLLPEEQERILNQFLPLPAGKKIGNEKGSRSGGRPVSRLKRLRDFCMVRLMLNSGLRCSEVLALRRRDLELDTGRLFVHNGKGGKDRILWLCQADVDLIMTYLAFREDTKPDSLIFVNLRGEPLSSRYVHRMVQEVAQKAGIQKHVYPHLLRHSFATDLLRATKNLLLVQRALGHARITTTTIYLHICDSELESALKTFRNL